MALLQKQIALVVNFGLYTMLHVHFFNRSPFAGLFSANAPEPPTVGKVDHHSIELFWEHESDGNHTGDKRCLYFDRFTCFTILSFKFLRVKFTLQEEDRKTKEFRTVYKYVKIVLLKWVCYYLVPVFY